MEILSIQLNYQNNYTENDLRHLNTKSDSEVILNVFAHALEK